MFQVARSLGWEKTPCVVEASRVVTIPATSARNSATYRIEIVYRYDFHGERYSSGRYQFVSGSSGGRARKQRVVDEFPPGLQTVCYVDPGHPAEAILYRGLNLEMLLGCFTLLFAGVGGVGFYFILIRRGKGAPPSHKSAVPTPPPVTGESIELKPQLTPLGKFIGLLAFAILWNGFIGVFAYMVFFSQTHGSVPIFAKIFVGGFCLLGVMIFFAAVGSFFALFNPRVVLMARTNAVPLGGVFTFDWRVQGRTDKVSKLRIVLEGREEASSFHGKSTSTYTSVFAEIPVMETLDHEVASQGQARVTAPAGLIHTFNGGHNRIAWRLRVHGEIPKWAPIDQEHVILVLPLTTPA